MRARQYKLVHFVPDPFSGARVPVAALIQDEHGLRITRAPHLPGPDCLGRASAEEAMLMVLDSLQESDSFSALPRSAGPHVTLDVARSIPLDVDDAAGWVEKFVLPQRRERTTAVRATKSHQRATWG